MAVAIAYIVIASLLVFLVLVVIDTIKQTRESDKMLKELKDEFKKQKDANSTTNTKRGEE
jgi:uncharacterized protein YoxC